MQDSNPQGTAKRSSPPSTSKNSKKSRADIDTSSRKGKSKPKLWFGFSAMEALATDVGEEPLTLTKSVNEMVRSGYLESEAHELQTTKISFPRIKQEIWPIARADKIPGQQYHLTQLPFDVETNEKTGFSLIYNILLQFEKPQTCYIGEDIISITKVRLDMMKMELGNIVQPIAPLCSTKGDKAWNGMIKVHLRKPEVDGAALLEGRRVFLSHLIARSRLRKLQKDSPSQHQPISSRPKSRVIF